jgi:hypothetical protein
MFSLIKKVKFLSIFAAILLNFCFFQGAVASASSLQLKEMFSRAIPGDFVVFSQQDVYMLWHVQDYNEGILTIEEVSIPQFVKDSLEITWKDWLHQGAKGNTSWLMYEFDLKQGKVREFYSFTREAWLNPEALQSFLSTLLNISFSPIPAEYRQRLGYAVEGFEKKRPLWQPPLIVNGNRQEGITFSAWKGSWPKDGSEIAEKSVEIYLPEIEGPYPYYFPYWISFGNAFQKLPLRVVDSGKEMLSTKMYLPRPTPSFVRQPIIIGDSLTFSLEGPWYFEDYFVFCQEVGSFGEHSVPFNKKNMQKNEKGHVVVSIAVEDLRKHLQPNKPYKIIIVPKGFGEVFSESKPFTF